MARGSRKARDVAMEDIFYAVLALHIAGKPINKENIIAVLNAAGTSINEAALDAMVTFIESLKEAQKKKERHVDPRIVEFIASELLQQKTQTKQLEALLKEITKSAETVEETPASLGPEAQSQIGTPVVEEEMPAASSRVYDKEAVREEDRAIAEVPAEEAGAVSQTKGRYVYGVVAGKETVNLGKIGIEGNEVYTIPYQDLCAIVHNCPPEPYQSQDDETIKGWVKIHQNVLDEVKSRFGTVIPLGFDTILQPKDDLTSPNQIVQDWLKEDYDRLNALLEKLKNKDEYGIQVFYEPQVISEIILQQSEEIKKIKEEMATKSPGLAYMYKQKLERAVKAEMERLAEKWFKDFYANIKKHADDIVVEKTKKAEKGKVMLLNLSCLVSKEKVETLGEELDKINNMEGFSVRFTGPWPPYSFVTELPAEKR